MIKRLFDRGKLVDDIMEIIRSGEICYTKVEASIHEVCFCYRYQMKDGCILADNDVYDRIDRVVVNLYADVVEYEEICSEEEYLWQRIQ